ncbi:MAG: hypothetical protein II821_04815 [Treponema sp.]|nr:hypothetical protein [Treponema sp.]
MKKISLVLAALLCTEGAFALSNSTSLTFSVAPVEKDADDNVQFGGAYLLAESTLSDDYVTLGGKLYYKLKETDSKSEETQKLEIKRAYAKIRPFGNKTLELAIGKLYSYYLSGGYFSLTETYTGATRWGKTGVGLKSEISGFTFGLALPLTESYAAFSDTWGLNFGAEYDFSTLFETLPLKAGFSIFYNSTADEKNFTPSEKDFAECVSLNFSKKNLAFFKTFSVFAAFSHNAEPYVSNSVFKPVANYSNKDMKSSNLFSLAFRPTIGSVKITSESEIGHSIEGSMVPFYTALQVQFPIFGCVSLKPQFGYYAAYDTSDSSKSFDTLEFYPRFMAEIGKWTVTAGWDIFYKEVSDSEYRWLWEFPVTAKLKIGK